MIVAFTGPRNFTSELNLTDQLIPLIEPLQITEAIVGGAPGFDFEVSQALVELGIPTHLRLPNPGYLDYYWPRNSADVEWMKDNLEFAGYSSQSVYTVRNNRRIHSNFARNMDMIDSAQALIAGVGCRALQNPTGGTGHAIRYAQQQRKPVHALLD